MMMSLLYSHATQVSCCVAILILNAGPTAFAQSESAAERSILFNRDVRPILADKCYACHGPDQENRQAELRLDTQEGAMIDLGGYRAISPAAPLESELIKRISSNSEDAMPPADHPKQLTDREKKTLYAWIEQGAQWQAHWSYEPVRKPNLPEQIQDPWCNNYIDAFILRRQQEESLEPSNNADKRTLIRRLSFDLVGLPPSASEVNAYLADQRPNATERLIDRLLKSPHFGERLAMYWLDLVRYADTVGYHGDQDVSVSPYRDYVIAAFNSNKPFDQFTREQLAGDLLDSPTQEQLIASTYNRLGMMSAEGGVQPEEYLTKYASDRVRTASTVWLGSTLGCAECHDHKFDPFTSKDFYRFAAFFADIKEKGLYAGSNFGTEMAVPDAALPTLLKPIDEKLKRLTRELASTSPELDAAQREWERQLIQELEKWHTLKPQNVRAEGKTELEMSADGSVLASGQNRDKNTYSMEFTDPTAAGFTTLRLDALPHDSLPSNGPGRARNGNFVVSEIRLYAVDGDDEHPVELAEASASFEQQDGDKNPYGKWAAKATIDQDQKGSTWGWAVLPKVGNPHSLFVKLAKPFQGKTIKVVIEQKHDNPKHTLGRFRIAVSSATDANTSIPTEVPEAIKSILAQKHRVASDNEQLATYFRKVSINLAPLRREIEELQKTREQVVQQNTRSTLITETVAPREMRVLARGNWMDKTGEVVEPGVPHFLAQIDREGRLSRLDLANWITEAENPLAARVFVNRLWKIYFGTGLSKALDDLGSQGEVPSHPELLDALAVDFVQSGWDIKHMIKTLVMSKTYQQSSLPRSELATIDAYNRLLARQSRYRLDAELVRDNALAISGLLVRKVGGRSVKPYQPEGLYRHLNFPKRTYQADKGDDQYRRGVYTHWQRQFLHPAMLAFDAPVREECTAARPRSNTPLAALVLLNDPSYVEAARVFAERILERGGETNETRLRWMIQEALGREILAEETKVFNNLLEDQTADFRNAPEKANELINTGISTPDASVDAITLAAWTMVARGVLNMHETVTRN